MVNEERIYWVAWSKIKGVGAVLLQRLHQHFGSLSHGWKADFSSLQQVEGLGGKMVENIIAMRSQLDPQLIYQQHLKENPNFWTPIDSEYPRLLLEIPSPPPILYHLGKVNPLENKGIIPMIGIVGTRYPTEHGKKWTRKIAYALAKRGFTVVSGMALGIDAEAHNTALINRGRTIAVVGTGVNQVYPHKHQTLHQQIQKQGLIISEYPSGTAPARGNFPARNRIIAALCRAILIMEAPERSGALITARFGNEFGKDIYTLPNSPDIQEARGCLRLIHDGAGLIVNEDELMEMLGGIPELDSPKQLSFLDGLTSVSPLPSPPVEINLPKLEPSLQKVFDSLNGAEMPFDLIIEKTGLAGPQVSGILLQLELMGIIVQLPGMRYRKS
jgi:DNA processing protein